jgi:aminoglycoside phosphotransferase family enzyme/predicted kinase
VQRVETHASWVFLLEDHVFKVKRPVDLGFLDFRTLEARRAACEAEVRLNSRLAPSVYEGVVPVRRDAEGRACIGGDGPVVDWAVRMVRLPDARRADELLTRGQLTGEAIDALASHVASFHAAAASDAQTARLGSADAVLSNVEENFAQTAESIGRYLTDAEADELVRWQTAFVEGHRALFERRIAAGRVRDGHGDLRLEHVYFGAEGSPTIIDCIEFNERFRFADVCADVAFLSMDLAAHGRVDLAERLLARYARESNDFDLYALVDFYESYRAFVRAKVAAITAADEAVEANVRVRAEGEARRYFLLALSADRRSMLLPALVAVGGMIASGKSTLAERLAQEMSAPVIEADRVRKSLLGAEAEQRFADAAWQGAYDPVVTERVYAEVLRRAEVVLASGRPVVVDASFRAGAMRVAARGLAGRAGVPFRFVECRASAAVCRARLEARALRPTVSDGRLEIFDAFKARFEPAAELWPEEHVVLDTERPLPESLAALRARLDIWPQGLVA